MSICPPARIQEILDASSVRGLSDEEIEDRYERSEAARDLFRALELNAEERAVLISAISQSNRLLLSLVYCNWADAVIALRQIAETSDNPAVYHRPIIQLGIQTTNGFERLSEHEGVGDLTTTSV